MATYTVRPKPNPEASPPEISRAKPKDNFTSSIKIKEISRSAADHIANAHKTQRRNYDSEDFIDTPPRISGADLPATVRLLYAKRYFRDGSGAVGFCWTDDGDDNTEELRWGCRLSPSQEHRFEKYEWDEEGQKDGKTQAAREGWEAWNDRILRYFNSQITPPPSPDTTTPPKKDLSAERLLASEIERVKKLDDEGRAMEAYDAGMIQRLLFETPAPVNSPAESVDCTNGALRKVERKKRLMEDISWQTIT